MGRRALTVEVDRRRTIDLAWKIVKKKLKSQDKDRLSIAKDMVIKDMVGKEKVDMNAAISNEGHNILNNFIYKNRLQDTPLG